MFFETIRLNKYNNLKKLKYLLRICYFFISFIAL